MMRNQIKNHFNGNFPKFISQCDCLTTLSILNFPYNILKRVDTNILNQLTGLELDKQDSLSTLPILITNCHNLTNLSYLFTQCGQTLQTTTIQLSNLIAVNKRLQTITLQYIADVGMILDSILQNCDEISSITLNSIDYNEPLAIQALHTIEKIKMKSIVKQTLPPVRLLINNTKIGQCHQIDCQIESEFPFFFNGENQFEYQADLFNVSF